MNRAGDQMMAFVGSFPILLKKNNAKTVYF